MDDSEDARRAAKRVLEIQEPGTTKIVAFHSIEHHMIPPVIPLSYGNNYTIPAAQISEIRAAYRKRGDEILKNTEEMFKNANIDIETRLILDEAPEDYIDHIVDEENFDLVALGSKGDHSKVKEVFMGSVAHKVLSEAECDVLAVR
ncbi:MAG: universal stress protein [Promethearchaeota archaeon]|nr:MAG: universal stress protein [Candidatus Lokiarchaeota archaeon]